MSQPLYTQRIDTACATTIGAAGADAGHLAQWRAKLPGALAAVKQACAPEYNAIVDLPAHTHDLAEIEAVARAIREQYRTLLVVGMGGSSLGAQTLAAIAAPGGLDFHVLDNVDPQTFAQLVESLVWKETAFLIVTKSGTTVEVHALVAALFREARARGIDLARQCYCITIPNDNPLHRLARERGMRVVPHEEALCGRFSILSPVGLIPAAALGLDVHALRAGAQSVLQANTPQEGLVAEAAALNMALIDQGIAVHVLMHYVDRLSHLVAWYRQCWSESLGKNGMGTLPVRSRGATEQHSQLQLYLDGPADKYFTALVLDSSGQGPLIGMEQGGDTRLDYLSGRHLGDLLYAEQRATNDTLIEAGCPLRTLTLSRLDAETMGALLMHFTLETIYTAALMGVNPFNQPAVEAGKKKALQYLSA